MWKDKEEAGFIATCLLCGVALTQATPVPAASDFLHLFPILSPCRWSF